MNTYSKIYDTYTKKWVHTSSSTGKKILKKYLLSHGYNNNKGGHSSVPQMNVVPLHLNMSLPRQLNKNEKVNDPSNLEDAMKLIKKLQMENNMLKIKTSDDAIDNNISKQHF